MEFIQFIYFVIQNRNEMRLQYCYSNDTVEL